MPNRLSDRIMPVPDGCWLWTGQITVEGYGKLKGELAHRLTYVEVKGDIPDGLHIDHLCSVRACVNPDHLEAVTQSENNKRSGRRMKTCRRGHEWTDENTYLHRTKRTCRACRRIRETEYNRKRNETWTN